jgi:hypothetical protein
MEERRGDWQRRRGGDGRRWDPLGSWDGKTPEPSRMRAGGGLLQNAVRNRMLVSLRGGGGELGNLKP